MNVQQCLSGEHSVLNFYFFIVFLFLFTSLSPRFLLPPILTFDEVLAIWTSLRLFAKVLSVLAFNFKSLSICFLLSLSSILSSVTFATGNFETPIRINVLNGAGAFDSLTKHKLINQINYQFIKFVFA